MNKWKNKILKTLSPLSQQFSIATYSNHKSKCCWKTRAIESIFIVQHKCFYVKCAIKHTWTDYVGHTIEWDKVIAAAYQVKSCSSMQRHSKLKPLEIFSIIKYLRHTKSLGYNIISTHSRICLSSVSLRNKTLNLSLSLQCVPPWQHYLFLHIAYHYPKFRVCLSQKCLCIFATYVSKQYNCFLYLKL